ncbi:hypothetical protein RR11_3330 [Ruegeria sp. R11]|nr:hypothetical protein RR11_3330 [Ruegeria sp. R11]
MPLGACFTRFSAGISPDPKGASRARPQVAVGAIPHCPLIGARAMPIL